MPTHIITRKRRKTYSNVLSPEKYLPGKIIGVRLRTCNVVPERRGEKERRIISVVRDTFSNGILTLFPPFFFLKLSITGKRIFFPGKRGTCARVWKIKGCEREKYAFLTLWLIQGELLRRDKQGKLKCSRVPFVDEVSQLFRGSFHPRNIFLFYLGNDVFFTNEFFCLYSVRDPVVVPSVCRLGVEDEDAKEHLVTGDW